MPRPRVDMIPANPSPNERRLFETLDALNEYHDNEGLDELDLGILAENAQARAQLMLVAEVHKLRMTLDDKLHMISMAVQRSV